jgi:hypothetical protein
MVADIDMENVAPRYDLGSYADKPMQLMSMDEFEKEHPFTPPLPRRTVNPLRTTSKYGQHVEKFHWACDARGILRDFVFHPVAQGCFDVELWLGGKYVDRIGQYASKRDAKEEICKKHLATVEVMPNLKKRKVDDVDCLSAPARLDEEPWVNLIYGNVSTRRQDTCVHTDDPSQNTLQSINCLLRISNFRLREARLARGRASCSSRAHH